MNPFLAHLHADLRTARLTRRGATHLPGDVPRGTHKTYPRFPSITLPEPQRLSTTLVEALEGRRSGREGDVNVPVTRAEVGTMLGLALRRRDAHAESRNYPSGGALFPIETYLISTAFESQSPGVYHYNPTMHALERLWDLSHDVGMKDLARKPDALDVSMLLVFTSVWQRSSAKYGDLAYLHALLEAGHMSENVLLVGCALGLSVRPYAGFSDAKIIQLLDLNEEEEQPVHTVTICKKS